MNSAEFCQDIIAWMQEQVFSSGGKGAVFGLSGGMDSAVVAVLCKKAFGDQCLGLIMPCHSISIDQEHGELLAREFEVPYAIYNLDGVYDQILASLGISAENTAGSLALSNIKPRLRMTMLYYFAAEKGYRVIGTGNRSEIEIGYYTKHGDGGVDLEPIGDLLKEEVRELAGYLEVPRDIIEKKPSAGLWEDQNDEDEMGFTYRELDSFLKGEKVDPALEEKIKTMQRCSEHKRKMPPTLKR
ncbi:MAG: NAD(+) synthase [Bacillota bacterium]|nr:NAD(+) synthase [Bacillota bacterium]